ANSLLPANGHAVSPISAHRGADARALSAGLARLRCAIEHGLFVLHFQPIVSVGDRRVCHHEALIRLADRPDGRLLAPALFLPAAERYGLIADIDRLVLDRVIALLAEDANWRIAVNVSALSVTDGTLLAHIASRLQWHGVEPSRLLIEITETAAISDMAGAREFCIGVLTLGCGLALDDFGAGFRSLEYLKRLPFSHLKIDGEFIRQLPSSRIDQLLVSAIAGVARGMGAKTVAEFVGDEATLELLRSYGVDYAQGFAVGGPEPRLPVAA
ncbi:MAG TPA: EAL domain-containing protein, partial [Solirubrobacteraceae bacterium]|nr:EAL domain-containing protein [Solirubrobacteraceae bacterium]